MCVYIYIYIYVCVYIYIYMCVYICNDIYALLYGKKNWGVLGLVMVHGLLPGHFSLAHSLRNMVSKLAQ